MALRSNLCVTLRPSPERLPFRRDGYNFWKWRGHKVHYLVQGKGEPLLLVHGFGASVYHWRYNVPELAKHYQVYAMDLLGFGWSDKAVTDYDLLLWSDQVADFVKEMIEKPAILVGNSIGGLTVLQAASNNPQLVTGLALLNPAGRFQADKKNNASKTHLKNQAIGRFTDWIRRQVIVLAFRQIKQRARIRSALNSVYKNKDNVDDYLIDSISEPAAEVSAEEVFYRMISGFLFRPSDISIDRLLQTLSCPLLLVWGEADPLANSSKADKMKEVYSGDAKLVKLQAGHCPHDEVPGQVNQELVQWITDTYGKHG